jgi:hypothetical protein
MPRNKLALQSLPDIYLAYRLSYLNPEMPLRTVLQTLREGYGDVIEFARRYGITRNEVFKLFQLPLDSTHAAHLAEAPLFMSLIVGKAPSSLVNNMIQWLRKHRTEMGPGVNTTIGWSTFWTYLMAPEERLEFKARSPIKPNHVGEGDLRTYNIFTVFRYPEHVQFLNSLTTERPWPHPIGNIRPIIFVPR